MEVEDVVISEVEVEEIKVKENLMRVIQTLIDQEVGEDKIIRGQMEKDQIMKKDMIKDGYKVEENATYAEKYEESGESSFLLACRGEKTFENNTWYLDSGASNHMCGCQSMFVELDESVGGNIIFGDATKISVKGKCKILINLKNMKHEFISNVYYVTDRKNNILTLGQH
ncbi:uncharacterized protein LOC120079116 [Benincasa hispida]|uniref:uncharacterized protein LOC120079116 n=1 Tax=Benincasa hispida TaxID=102211 RepID=UPI00190166EA|nr:uncharacterized protein LOC120079116 [Benincasa hispida]